MQKVEGETDPEAVYLVLRLDQGGSDSAWTQICREAAVYLASEIKRRADAGKKPYKELMPLAKDILNLSVKLSR